MELRERSITYRSESYLVCFQNPFRIGNVQVSFSHGEGVVAGEVFHKLGRHSGLQHFGDAGVLERIEVIAVRHGEAGSPQDFCAIALQTSRYMRPKVLNGREHRF